MANDRCRQLSRLLRLIKRLTTGRYSLQQLAHAERVSTRTVRRDLEVIADAHMPLRKLKPEDSSAVWMLEGSPWNHC